MKKYIFIFIILSSFSTWSQNIGINTTNPSSIFEIENSNPSTPKISDGLLVPRVDNFITNPLGLDAFGLWDYNTLTAQNYYWDNPNNRFESFRNTLDQAYDSNGFGLGRTLNADSGALRIQGTDGFQVTGTFGSGLTLANTTVNNGLFFYPKKGTLAFMTRPTTIRDNRIGNYNIQAIFPSGNANFGTAFGRSDLTSSGNYSSVFGHSSTIGNGSVVMGRGFTAGQFQSAIIGQNVLSFTFGKNLFFGNNAALSYSNSFMFGTNNTAINVSGQFNFVFAFIMGNNNYIGDDLSVGTILGFNNTIQTFGSGFIIGNNNTLFSGLAIGNHINSFTPRQITFGAFNTSYTPDPLDFSNLVPNNRLFVVGNGTSSTSSDAMVMREDGRTGYGNSFPETHADVDGGFAINPDTLQTITFSGQTISTVNKSYLKIDSTGLPINNTVTFDDGVVNGQMLLIECIASGGNGFQIPNSLTNVAIGPTSLDLLEDDTITFLWNGIKWLKIAASNN